MLQDGLILDLPLREKDGDAFMSNDVYGHRCTNHGSNWNMEGHTFDGINDYIDCGTNAILNSTDEMTISIWIYPLFNIGDVSATYADRIGFYTNTRNVWYTFRGGKQYIMYLNNADVYDSMYGTKSTWNINKWYNLIFTYSILNNEANLYVNGIIDNTCADNGVLKAGGVTSIIGYYNKHFNGSIGQTYLYNRALTATEILSYFNTTKVRYGL